MGQNNWNSHKEITADKDIDNNVDNKLTAKSDEFGEYAIGNSKRKRQNGKRRFLSIQLPLTTLLGKNVDPVTGHRKQPITEESGRLKTIG